MSFNQKNWGYICPVTRKKISRKSANGIKTPDFRLYRLVEVDFESSNSSGVTTAIVPVHKDVADNLEEHMEVLMDALEVEKGVAKYKFKREQCKGSRKHKEFEDNLRIQGEVGIATKAPYGRK